jgi:pimeloyl-ACP methyl ester carboxylesterase
VTGPTTRPALHAAVSGDGPEPAVLLLHSLAMDHSIWDVHADPEVGEALLDTFRANDIDSYGHVCRAMGAFDARGALAGIDVPTRVLVGELDPATPLPHAELLARSIPGATLRVVPGAGHMSPVEDPQLLVDELIGLRERVTAR